MPEWLTTLLAHPTLAAVLRLVVLALIFLLLRRALRLGLNRLEARVQRTVDEADRRQRLSTLLHAGYGVIVVVVGVLTLAMFLETVGVSIGPLLASAGVVGLAISLGAQTLIRDYLGGVLILVEDNFRVGDAVEINGNSGQVARISLRVTHLRDLEGRLHVIPNGDIRTVTNLTREWARAIVDVTMPYGADMDQVGRALEKVTARLQADENVQAALLGPAEVLAWNAHSEVGVQLRVMVKTAPGQHWRVSRVLRQRVLEALSAEGLRPAR